MKRLIILAILLPLISSAQNNKKIQSSLETINIETGKRTIIYKDSTHFEAPNWSKDGSYFIVNKKGKLYSINKSTKAWQEIPFHPNLRANNDHGISPDGNCLSHQCGRPGTRR